MTTSCQPRKPQRLSSGIAAIRAASGTPTNRPTRKRWKAEFGSSATSGRGARRAAGAAGAAGSAGRPARSAGPVPVTLTVSGIVVIVLLRCGQRDTNLYAYVTVAYVIVG